jgi:hypothetical protein
LLRRGVVIAETDLQRGDHVHRGHGPRRGPGSNENSC